MMKNLLIEQNLLNKNKTYIVGVSGGPDSMFLLDFLIKNNYKIIIAHLNYQKRNDSYLDQQLIEKIATKHNLTLELLKINNYSKENFQKQARDLRYHFFCELAIKYKATGIIIAHHLDDVLETILMQKARGLEKVYWGIKKHSIYNKTSVFRPLLQLPKKQILAHCNQNQIEYCIDSSNLTNNYQRNYIRNEILKNYSQTAKEKLLLEAKKHNDFLEKENKRINNLLKTVVINNSLYYQNLNQLDLYDILYQFLDNYSTIPKHRLSKTVILDCIKILKSQKPNIEYHLPVNHLLIKKYDNVSIALNKSNEYYEYIFNEYQNFECPYFKLTNSGNDREGVNLKKSDFPIKIRSFINGDTIKLNYGTKKVSRLFIDAKIPSLERKKWPILLNCQNEIILIPKIGKNKDYLMEKPTLFVVEWK